MEIYGIGFDLTEIERFKDVLEREAFSDRVYSKEEQKMIKNKGQGSLQTAAANFAAKEAFLKSLGKGISDFPLKEIEVLRKESGQPYIRLSKELSEALPDLDFDVTLSHTKTTAGAVVLAKRR